MRELYQAILIAISDLEWIDSIRITRSEAIRGYEVHFELKSGEHRLGNSIILSATEYYALRDPNEITVRKIRDKANELKTESNTQLSRNPYYKNH